jgi:hypothetical protein
MTAPGQFFLFRASPIPVASDLADADPELRDTGVQHQKVHIGVISARIILLQQPYEFLGN